jgi:hypothetical protein
MNLTSVFALRVAQALGSVATAVLRAAPKFRPASRYRASHRSLLVDLSKWSGLEGPRLDFIFMPIGRPFTENMPGLELATALALDQGCHLVVAYSKRARPGEFPVELKAALGHRLMLINHTRVHLDWKPQLESARQRVSRFHRDNDAADKRNLGLALASVLGWQTMLLMDDDIFSADRGPTLNVAGLRGALSALHEQSGLRAVGWSARTMDDHSVVGHARKLTGMKQDLFVGAGALLVRCDDQTSYFPNIYNHDWLFLIALAKKAPDPFKAIGWAGTVRQLEYDPYIPWRARSEEPGEVIGECFMNLLHDHGANFEQWSNARFWKQALLSRRKMVARLQRLVGRRAGGASFEERSRLLRVQRALAAAAEVNRDLTPADLERYVQALRSDEDRWESHLAALNRAFAGRPDPGLIRANLRSGKPPAPNWKSGPVISPRPERRPEAGAGEPVPEPDQVVRV